MKNLYFLIPAILFFFFSVQPADAALKATCNVSPSSGVIPGEEVTWEVDPSGGSSVYEYEWTGSEGLSGDRRSAAISYETEGLKWAQVTVTSGDEQKVVECSQVRIEHPPLRGSCSVQTTASNENIITEWSTDIIGGSGEYIYSWSGDEGLLGSSSTVEKIYTTGGFKEASVTVSSDGESIHLTCNTTVPSISKLSEEPIMFGCEIEENNYATEQELTWNALYEGNRNNWDDDITYRWEIDNERKNRQQTDIRYEESGYKVGIVTTYDTESSVSTKSGCQAYIVDEDLVSKKRTKGGRGISTNGNGDSGCFIATAAYGSLLAPEVETLRSFRDAHLQTSAVGRTLVRTYYFASPPLASVIEKSDVLKLYARIALTPVIAVVKILN